MTDFPIIHIRHGTPADVDVCQRMTRQHPKSFPFVMKSGLLESVQHKSLFIAEIEGLAVGFVSFRACRDGWQTIYELCVDEAAQGQGVGRALLYAVPCPIRLKCPVDLEASNRFYANAGMILDSVDTRKARHLNVWHMRVLTIHCQGNNRKVPMWALKSGMAYGTRHNNAARAWPFMLDIDFDQYYKKGKKPKPGKPDMRRDTTEEEKAIVWKAYYAKALTLRPVAALVPDYMTPNRKEIMLSQIEQLRRIGIMRIMVAPKFTGAVADIPADCLVAVSVPSSYAGFVPELSELRGRRVHLLGGNPQAQADLVTQLGGLVISTDYNVHERNAQKGTIFQDGKLLRRRAIEGQITNYDELVPYSGANIRKHINGAATVKQPQLL